jgi:hypothetical protein
MHETYRTLAHSIFIAQAVVICAVVEAPALLANGEVVRNAGNAHGVVHCQLQAGRQAGRQGQRVRGTGVGTACHTLPDESSCSCLQKGAYNSDAGINKAHTTLMPE